MAAEIKKKAEKPAKTVTSKAREEIERLTELVGRLREDLRQATDVCEAKLFEAFKKARKREPTEREISDARALLKWYLRMLKAELFAPEESQEEGMEEKP